MSSNLKAATSNPQHHTAIVLFYKYFDPSIYPLLQQHPQYYEEKLLQFQRELCHRLKLKGRVLLAAEGINGTLSASRLEVLKSYISEMERFDLLQDCGAPEVNGDSCSPETKESPEYKIFTGIDWKETENHQHILEPFPDLKVTVSKEIISSGGTVSVDDIRTNGGQHLSPAEFHKAIQDDPNVVLIDVRNTFEYDIGHFVNPNNNQAAVNPEMVTFSSFDPFCARRADQLQDKKVLMYCTGGIRCEKASVMLKKRGVKDVSQLKGGIHRYLEEYGDEGFFRGSNFVFDQRIAMKPSECCLRRHGEETKEEGSSNDIVGRCVECSTPFDEICGSRVCTVCRDLVLVCRTCQAALREYHCRRHSDWKKCYFTFLEVFDRASLESQRAGLLELRDIYVPPPKHKNVRRTISRQVEKITDRIQDLESGNAVVDPEAPRRCRTCMDPNTLCDGRCWGFWKTQAAASRKQTGDDKMQVEALHTIQIGTQVEPGPHWNSLRHGTKLGASGSLKRGVVVELKSWGAGGSENDCVAVVWNDGDHGTKRRAQPQIYRWGTIALNGTRMYDLQKVEA